MSIILSDRSHCCLNCGRRGHSNKTCREPINSYGCIVCKMSPDRQWRYLMIQRKYTPEYVELLRGRYYMNDGHTVDFDYLCLLIGRISLIERHYLLQHPFSHLWEKLWRWSGTDDQIHKIQRDYQIANSRFESLKRGIKISYELQLQTFQTLFEKFKPLTCEPEWEFPKGKRQIGENDQQCAVRECCEETSLRPEDFNLLLYVKPLLEQFTATNEIQYCNRFYLAQLTAKGVSHPIYYDYRNVDQNTEIRNIGWYTETEIRQLIENRPNHGHRLELISDLSKTVSSLTGML